MKKKTLDQLVGINLNKRTRKVKQTELKRIDPKGSLYRSICPACNEGVLLMRRGNDGKLLAKDNCLLCGQSYEYTDIKMFNTKEGN